MDCSHKGEKENKCVGCGDQRVKRKGPEGTVLWNRVELVSVNPEGESRHGQVWAKVARKEREHQAKMEEKVGGEAPSDEGAEIQSPKRNVIRVETEETQDYVRESLNLSWVETEEISFLSSAISIPQRPMFWCDNICSEKALRILAVCFGSGRGW